MHAYGQYFTRIVGSIVSDRFVEDKTQLFGRTVCESGAKWLGGCVSGSTCPTS